ncbi:hypothetical protein ULMS_16960 [Patiriisocius marinistellae]|uniref:Uncharacterized protein n=1 Tax=Patiriisocius marinistellae TaxID=2494560 RepID=A0A5J4FXW7_9FLAO|nr:hypothetical protein [Patiriisocius marinistellae]GEQ86188.1 hypothetical protein ULMS_16960 [Patiriisocius marinistellae]
MKKIILISILCLFASIGNAQNTSIDGRLKPLLEDFFKQCDNYGIAYHEKLFKLKKIAVVEDLKTSPNGSILGMLQRDKDGVVENIVVNWVAMLDTEILKVVAFHEFGHYFLEYSEHTCNDCGTIMARVNSSYFIIANDWDNQLKILFKQSPAYKNKLNTVVSTAY